MTSGPDVTVAGRPAYQLVLTPKDAGTLVGSVTIAIDAAERVPTRVTVTSTVTGQPALTVGFTDVSFTAPDPSVFAFTPPAGATVKEKTAGDSGAPSGAPATGADTPSPAGRGQGLVERPRAGRRAEPGDAAGSVGHRRHVGRGRPERRRRGPARGVRAPGARAGC